MFKIGDRVIVSKREYQNKSGLITGLVGSGQARRWTVKFDNDEEYDFQARSLEKNDEYDSSDNENDHESGHEQSQSGQNHSRVQGTGLRSDLQSSEDDGEFDEEWIRQANAALYVYHQILFFPFY